MADDLGPELGRFAEDLLAEIRDTANANLQLAATAVGDDNRWSETERSLIGLGMETGVLAALQVLVRRKIVPADEPA